MNTALGGTSYYVGNDNAFTPKQNAGMMSPGSSYSAYGGGGNSTRYAAMSTHGPSKSPAPNQPSASYYYQGSPHAAQHSSYSPTNVMVAFQTPSYSPMTPNYN